MAGLAPPSPRGRGDGGEGSGRQPYARHPGAVARARRLRAEMTDAERLLWSRIRRDALGLRVRRQHPVGPFVVDFYLPVVRLAVEIDGGQHAAVTADDARRSAVLNRHGVSVLRFWDTEVLGNPEGVVAAILAVAGTLGGRGHGASALPFAGSVALDHLRLSLAERAEPC